MLQRQVLVGMGQGQNQQSHPGLDSNWVTLSRDSSLFSNVNPYSKRTLRNATDNQEVQQYEIEFVSEYDFRHYVEELRVRLEPSKADSQHGRESHPESYFHLSPYIYTVKYFVDSTLQDMCSTTYKGLLYAQKVDLRLKEINDIPLSDLLCLTKATLQGFKLLYQKFGYFDISEEMVFISKEGRVRVWINSNLAKNEPVFIPQSAYRQSHGSQSDMLVQLLDMVELNSDDQQQGIHFREYLVQKNIYNRLSFYRALDEFEAYCMQQHHVVDSAMTSIYELYHQDEPEHSEVLEMSLHRANPTSQGNQQQVTLKNQVTPTNRNSFPDLKFASQHEDQAQMVGSRASKQSERHPRHNSQHAHQDFIRTKSTNSHAQKLAQPQGFSYNSSQNHLSSPNQTHPLNPRNLPLGRRIEQLGQQVSRESPAPLPKRPESLSIDRNGMFPSHHPNTALIKFNYLPNSTSSHPPKNYPPNNYPAIHPPNNYPAIHPLNNYSGIMPNSAPALPSSSIPVRSVFSGKQPQTAQSPETSKPKLPSNLMTIHSIQTQSNWSGNQLKPAEGEAWKKMSNSRINYYSSDQTYTLDKEIAEDLQKFLGYSPRS